VIDEVAAVALAGVAGGEEFEFEEALLVGLAEGEPSAERACVRED
jgi:hypothetical protein